MVLQPLGSSTGNIQQEGGERVLVPLAAHFAAFFAWPAHRARADRRTEACRWARRQPGVKRDRALQTASEPHGGHDLGDRGDGGGILVDVLRFSTRALGHVHSIALCGHRKDPTTDVGSL